MGRLRRPPSGLLLLETFDQPGLLLNDVGQSAILFVPHPVLLLKTLMHLHLLPHLLHELCLSLVPRNGRCSLPCLCKHLGLLSHLPDPVLHFPHLCRVDSLTVLLAHTFSFD